MAVSGTWRVGEVVDRRYEVLRVHEHGGMGLVYRVRHLEWGTDLAVKCPRPEAFGSEAQRELFVAEAEIWVSLGLHPNVCGCHYVRVLDGIPRVFAEYVPGGSLRDWIDDRRLYAGDRAGVLARILDVAVQFAWGLAHAHDHGLVHQDVKPGNVLLDVATGGVTAKVTDFGLARAKAVATAPLVTDGPAGVSVLVSSRGLSAGGYTDRTIRLWDTATGECLCVFGDDPDLPRGVSSVPKAPRKQVRFSPDGRFALSGGTDTSVRIWDLGTGRCLRVLDGHDGEVHDVVFGPDARYAFSASSDGTIRRWELDWDLRAP